MRDGLRAIHGAGPGEDELAADAACGQPAAGPGGDGKYDHRAKGDERHGSKRPHDTLRPKFRTTTG